MADVSFGVNGISTLRIPVKSEIINAAILQSDGKYYFGGYSNYFDNSDFFLGRINHNGIGDTSFGTGGLVLTPLPMEEKIRSLALSPAEDKLYAAGYSTEGSNNSIIIAAYHTLPVTGPPVYLAENRNNTTDVYPNPSDGFVTIKTDATGIHRVQVFDLAGNELLSKRYTGEIIEINLAQLQPSVYFIRVTMLDNHTMTGKLIMQ